MLREHQRVWQTYPVDLRAALHVIVVDDGSPRDPARSHVDPAGVAGLASFQLFRTGVDVRWNWLFCRNLGMAHAPTEWVILTDIDHVLPGETLRTLTTLDLDTTMVYRTSRTDAPHRTPYKPHPNTWILTRAMFERIGGYDERFSGYYGSDSEFRERVHRAASAIAMLPDDLIRYPREVISDASTTTYQRKTEADAVAMKQLKNQREKIKGWQPLRLTFPYALELSC